MTGGEQNWLNRRAAKAVAVRAGGTPRDRHELLQALGLVDGPDGRVVTADDTRELIIATLGTAMGTDLDERPVRHRVDEPPSANVTTPPGLRILPPPAATTEATPAPARRGGNGRPPAACGTRGGHRRHKDRGEQPCQPCLEAARAFYRERNAARRAAAKTTEKRTAP